MIIIVGDERWWLIMKEWMNINELAERTLIPDTTVRRYISKFSTYFFSKGGARSKRYEDSGVKVLIRIKQLYDDGFESDEVDRVLKKEFAVVVDGDNEQEQTAKPVTPTLATVEDIAKIMDALKQQQDFNKLLIDKLANQDKYIRESMEKRDNLLLESLRAIQDEKLAIAETTASNEGKDEKKPSFFSRIFK